MLSYNCRKVSAPSLLFFTLFALAALATFTVQAALCNSTARAASLNGFLSTTPGGDNKSSLVRTLTQDELAGGEPLRAHSQESKLYSIVSSYKPFETISSELFLTTLFASDNGYAGNMFDVQVNQPLTITRFQVNLDTFGSVNTIEIYYRFGTCVGHENSPSGWILLGTDSDVVSNGVDVPTPVNIGGLTLNPGQVYGFYVNLASYPSSVLKYTNGGPTIFSNSQMSLTTNCGNSAPAFSGVFYPRQWNGTIYYTVGPLDDLSVTPPGGFASSGGEGGPFTPPSKVYTLTDTNSSNSLNWTATKTSAWLDVTPAGGTLGPGNSNNVNVVINANANALPPGTYTDTVTFTNTTSGSTQTRDVTLTVGTKNILAYIQYSDNSSGGEYQNTLTAIRSVGTNFTVTEMTDYTQLSTLLPGHNVLLVPEQENTDDSTLKSIGATWAVTLQNFVNNGGVVIVCDYSAGYGILTGAGLMNITSKSYFYNQTVNVIAPDDPVAKGVPSTYIACDGSLYYATTEGRVVVQLTGYGPVVIDKEIGLGNAVLIGHDYFSSNAQQNMIVGNAVFYLPPIHDNLSVVPATDFNSSGNQGGPFTPPSKVYTLTDTNGSSLNWTATKTSAWLDITPAGGTLGPSDSNNVNVVINANANTLPPGDYSDLITFTNVTSGVVQTRKVTLRVIAIPGKIDVTDTIPPPDDLKMPFGNTFIGLPRTEHITIANIDPTYDLNVADISFGSASSTETPDILVVLPAVDGNTDSSGDSYLQDGWLNHQGRPESQLVINGGYRGLNSRINVLLLAGGSDPTILRTGLSAFPDVNSVIYFDARSVVPTLAQLSAYDVVVIMTDYPLYDSTQTGNVLADYVDSGGRVIEAVASFATGGSWELGGRFVTGDYEAFGHGPPERFSHSLGSFDNTHPIMSGVTALGDSLPAGVTLKPQANWVASWNNSTPLVATRGDSVVGINIFAFDGGSFTGDVVLLFHNAAVWLVGEAAAGFTLTNVPSLPAIIPPSSNVTFDVTFAPTKVDEYKSSVVIKSNDKDNPEVDVSLSGTGILDYMSITPDANFTFSGHPGGPFLPSNTYYYLTNNGIADINWAVTGPDWLNISTLGGIIHPGGTTKVKVSPNTLARSKGEGVYQGQLLFTDITTTVQQTRGIILSVSTEPKLWMTPNSFDARVYQGDNGSKILTIGNGGDGLLNFMLKGRQTGFTPASMPAVSIYSSMVETQKDVAAMAPAGHSFAAMQKDAAYTEGRVIVRFAPQADRKYPELAAKNSILSKIGNGKLAAARVMKEYKLVHGMSLVKLPDNVTVKEALVALNNAPGVLYAEPDYQVKALQTIPNDPRFSELWGMNNTGQNGGTPDADIDAPEAWDIATDCGNIVVAVIDTGVDYTHPDLAANMWTDSNGHHGYDFVNNDDDPMDDNGHGTHCAGTIGAIGNNGIGVAGVCWKVKIMAIKFLDSSGSGTTSGAIEAIQYATLKGANLSSNSWGGGGYSQALKDAIDAAGNANMLFVAAAGNSSSDNDASPFYPASYTSENIIAVLATDRYDNMSSFSNYGLTSVDIGAPGSDILSCQPGSNYQYMSGTSMATPHVSGAAALVWSFYPSMPYQEVKDLLIQTADKIPALAGRCVSQGRLNLFNAVKESGVSWLEFVPQSGSALPGEVNDVSVLFHGDVPVGTYQGQITALTNDPYTPEVNIPVTMTVEPLDYFTELFDAGDNDMAHRILTFMPNGSYLYYSLCTAPASKFPVDPNGGTVVSLNDDDYYEVPLQGHTINFYGTNYDTFYIGSNGYITFDSGDTHYFETISEHFALPRISALFDDLNPSAGGTISYKELADRVVVTFQDVPEFSQTTTNSFQIEMFYWGKIRITFLNIAAVDGLAGLSQGAGVPPYFAESDLSEYGSCGSADLDKDGNVDFVDFAVFARYWMEEDCAGPGWCGGADINKSRKVDVYDLMEFADEWLRGL